jgi:predicted DNA-binding protein (UPF0251 family)
MEDGLPRRKKCRFVCGEPLGSRFLPEDAETDAGEVALPLEAFEAIRLVDYEGLDQETAASAIHVSRQTLGRILEEARKTVAKALVEGRALRIEGGSYEFCPLDTCPRRFRHRFRGGFNK